MHRFTTLYSRAWINNTISCVGSLKQFNSVREYVHAENSQTYFNLIFTLGFYVYCLIETFSHKPPIRKLNSIDILWTSNIDFTFTWNISSFGTNVNPTNYRRRRLFGCFMRENWMKKRIKFDCRASHGWTCFSPGQIINIP